MQVSIVTLGGEQVKVLSHAYDCSLGGRVFDDAIFKHLAADFGRKLRVDILKNPEASFMLRLACEKVLFSTTPGCAT